MKVKTLRETKQHTYKAKTARPTKTSYETLKKKGVDQYQSHMKLSRKDLIPVPAGMFKSRYPHNRGCVIAMVFFVIHLTHSNHLWIDRTVDE
jgi:hypothetical protein